MVKIDSLNSSVYTAQANLFRELNSSGINVGWKRD